MKRFLRAIVNFFSFMFGNWKLSLAWDKPAWLKKLNQRVASSIFGKVFAKAQSKWKASPYTKPKPLATISFSLMLLIGGGLIGYSFYKNYLDSLPKPDYVYASVLAPELSDPETKEVFGFRIKFTKPAAKLKDIGKEVNLNTPQISPSVEGTWKWQDESTLVFTPANLIAFQNDWLVGSEYQIKLNTQLFAKHLEFSKTNYSFTTPQISLKTIHNEFYIHPNNNKIRKALFTIKSNTPLNTEEIKKKITLDINTKENSLIGQGNTTLTPTISFNNLFTEVYIESPPLDMVGPDRFVKLKIKKNVTSLRGGKGSLSAISSDVEVPGRFSAFKVDTPKVIFARNNKFEPEQILVVETAVGVRSEDILESLQVYLLPELHDRTTQRNGKTITVRDVKEWSYADINEKTLKKAEELKLEALPTSTPYSQSHSFKVTVPVERYMYFKLAKGVKAMGDFELGKNIEHIIKSPDYSPELMFMSEGAILSLSGDGKLPLLSRNVQEVNFEVSKILPQQINFLISKMLQNNSFKHPSHENIADLISERETETQNIPFISETETQYFSLDLKKYQNNSGFFYIQASATKTGRTQKQYGYNKPSDRRLILLTDIGMIAKHTSSKELHVYAQNLRTGKPVAGAKIDILGKNGIPVVSQKTNANGFTVFPKMNFYREQQPLAIVAHHGSDISYLPYMLASRQLSYSRFNVGGTHAYSTSEELNAMMFSDRGLYRPGENVNIGMILRTQLKETSSIEGLPLTIEVHDPKGHLIKKEKQIVNLFSLQDFKFKTEETSPTGTYNIRMYLMKEKHNRVQKHLISSTEVNVEEFQPDKLKIHTQLTPSKSTGWIPSEDLLARVSLKNMFGTAAEDRLVKAELELVPTVPKTAQYKDYRFKYSKSDWRTIKENLPDQKTDKNGEVEYKIDLKKYEGFYSVIVRTQGYETGSGRSVQSFASVYASPWSSIVGYKSDGSLSYIKRGAQRHVDIISLNSDLKPSEDEIILELNEIKFVSALIKQDNGSYKYQSIKKDVSLEESRKSIPATGLQLSLPTDRAGNFAYIIKDKNNNELNRFEFTIVGAANLTRSLDRNAELQIGLNKADYSAGETIELQILAPYKGSGLITIEREEVLAYKWFSTTSNSTTEHIKIPENVTGNAYVNVTFLRAIDSSEIYTSPLSYGVQAFSISLDKYKTKIELQAPEKVKPGEELKIQYSASRPTSLILYGVDEGILQVAKYKLPDPLSFFFQKKALQVRTFQLLDLLMPEYSLIVDSSPGGDASVQALQRNLNPFKAKSLKPVAFWSGVLQANTKKQSFTYEVPDHFNGSIKIMAVASSKLGLGSTETSTLSRGDFIITPTAPVFVTPDDEIEVSLNIANQNENTASSEDLEVSVKSSSHLEVSGTKSHKLEIPVGREKGAAFKFKAQSQYGAASLKFLVSNGTESATYTHHLSVRPAVPYITTIQSGLASALPIKLISQRRLAPDLAVQELAVSTLPLSIGSALMEYLDKFPYGCTEQLISKAVPALLAKTYDLRSDKPTTTHDHIISILQRRQRQDGGFALYENQKDSHTPSSLYAITYLLEAKRLNLETPREMEVQVLEYLKSTDLRQFDNIHQTRLFANALYLQTQYGINPKGDLTYLEQLLEKKYSQEWEQDAIAIYLAGIYQTIQEKKKGWKILSKISLKNSVKSNYRYYYDKTTHDGIYLRMVAKHFPEHLTEVLNDEAWSVFLNPIQQGFYNTQSAAQVLLAFASIDFEKSPKLAFENMSVQQTNEENKSSSISLSGTLVMRGEVALDSKQIRLKGSAPSPLFYSYTQSGFDLSLPNKELKKEIEIHRAIEDAKGNPIEKINMGDNVYISVSWRALEKDRIPHIVIVDLLPAGFEFVRNSIQNQSYDYIDTREDRLVIYTSASEDTTRITYQLRATHKGKFNLPAIFGESLYDKNVQYRGVTAGIEVF